MLSDTTQPTRVTTEDSGQLQKVYAKKHRSGPIGSLPWAGVYVQGSIRQEHFVVLCDESTWTSRRTPPWILFILCDWCIYLFNQQWMELVGGIRFANTFQLPVPPMWSYLRMKSCVSSLFAIGISTQPSTPWTMLTWYCLNQKLRRCHGPHELGKVQSDFSLQTPPGIVFKLFGSSGKYRFQMILITNWIRWSEWLGNYNSQMAISQWFPIWGFP